MMDEDEGAPIENARRKAATNAFLNISKRSCSKMKRVTWLLRKRQEDKQLTTDEQQFLADNPKLVDQFHKRREKREEYQLRHIEKEDSPEVLKEKCSQLAQAIHDAEFLVAYTGAGISTAASIPDYRGPNGIWTRLQKGQDIGTHDLTEAEPTLTHMALSALQQCGRLQHVVSQNCDGLHLRSGLPKSALSEVHGNMYIEVCRKCSPPREYVRTFDVTERTSTFKHQTGRRCYRCGEPLIDTIVHFGERGKLRWPLNWQGACQAANACDTILCLGSSLKVLKKYPWLWQMDRPARRRPRLFVVNLQWTPKDKEATVKINGKCDEVMNLVMQFLGMKVNPYNRSEDLIFDMSTPLHPDELCTTARPCLAPAGLTSKKPAKNNLGGAPCVQERLCYSCNSCLCSCQESSQNNVENSPKCDISNADDEVGENKNKALPESRTPNFCRKADCIGFDRCVDCLVLSNFSKDPCKCEIMLRQLHASSVSSKLLSCSSCCCLFAIYPRGKCNEGSLDCSVPTYFCRCLESIEPCLDNLISDEKWRCLQDKMKSNLHDQQNTIDGLLNLKKEIDVKVKEEFDVKPLLVKKEVELACEDMKTIKTEDLESILSNSSIKFETSDSQGPEEQETTALDEDKLNERRANGLDAAKASNDDTSSLNAFYGTGLCIRSSVDSCNESSSQDEFEDDMEMESELESVECSEMEDNESEETENDDSNSEFNVKAKNASEQKNSSSVSYVSYSSLCNSDVRTINVQDIMEISSETMDEEASKSASDVRWKNGSMAGSLNEGINHFTSSKSQEDASFCDEIDFLDGVSNNTLVNGTRNSHIKSLVNEKEAAELKNIWFNSFCKPRPTVEALNHLSGQVCLEKNKYSTAIVNNSKLPPDSKSTCENVRNLWFWGFDEAMIRSNKSMLRVPLSNNIAALHCRLSDLSSSTVEIFDEKSDEINENKNNDKEADDEDESRSNLPESPPRRITRSKTRSNFEEPVDSDSDDEEVECWCSGSNPELCRKSRELSDFRIEADENMLRVRATISKRRTLHYKRYDPVFSVRLKSVTVDTNKRKSSGKKTISKNSSKAKKVDFEEEDDMEADEAEKELCEDIVKKINPGWYGKGCRKNIRKKTPKSYPLKL